MLSIALRPSHFLAALLAVMHGAALASAWLVALPLPARIGATAVLAFSFLHAARRYAWRADGASVCGLRLQGECACALQGTDGAWREATLLPSSFVSVYLAVLNLQVVGEKRVVVILPDALDAEQFRQLRVWLRWKCAAPESSQPGT